MIEYDYELTIYGDPRPQGRPRTRIIQAKNKDKAFATIYDDPKSKKAKENIKKLAWLQAPKPILDCPLRVDLMFYMPRPLAHYGTGRNSDKLKESSPTLHTKRPDIDNLRKLVMDALTGVFWRDDSLVCKGTTEKIYSDKPRTEIYINKISLLTKVEDLFGD